VQKPYLNSTITSSEATTNGLNKNTLNVWKTTVLIVSEDQMKRVTLIYGVRKESKMKHRKKQEKINNLSLH